MTFLAPSFIFVFLPIVLSVYSLVPKYLKPYALPAIGIIFYLLVNMRSPFALIALPVVVAAVVISSEVYKRKKIRVWLEVCRIASMLAIFAVLILRVFGKGDALSGIGVIIMLMSAVSLCSDVLWGQGRVPDTAWDTVIYMTFFPLFMVGPFVKYGDFVEKIDRLDFGLENFTSGILRLVVGFVKCVSISAVLGEAYDVLFSAVTLPKLSFLSALILILIRGTGFFCFISGYSDMAIGISSMFGIRIARDYGNFFCNVTPCEFIRNFFSSLLDFCRSYITVPVSVIVSGIQGTAVAAVFASFFYALIFSKNMETVYTLMIPLTASMMLIVLRTGKKRRRVRLIPKIAGCTLTFFLASAVIWYIYMNGPDGALRSVENVFSNPALLLTPKAVSVLRDVKYFLIPASAGICVWAVGLIFKKDNAYLDAIQSGKELSEPRGTWVKLTAKYILSFLLLLSFVFTVIMVLPQYPYLAGVNYFFPFV